MGDQPLSPCRPSLVPCATCARSASRTTMRMVYIGDTKAGTLIGTDRAGNKFFENMEELPLRTRWVEYAKHDYDAAQIEPGWHAWMSYLGDKLLQTGGRAFEPTMPKPNFTMGPGAFKTYSTTKSKITPWQPVAAQRS